MTTKDDNFSTAKHDWRSQAYVDAWINRDIQRDGERRPRLGHTLTFAPIAKAAEITVPDVAGGIPLHLKMLTDAGLTRAECVWEQPPVAIIAAFALK